MQSEVFKIDIFFHISSLEINEIISRLLYFIRLEIV